MSFSDTSPFPATSNPRRTALMTEGTTRPVKLLALKFMLTRMQQDVKRHASSASVGKAVDELCGFFIKSPQMAVAEPKTLFG